MRSHETASAGLAIDAQMRQHVLDVRRLDKLEAAALDERDIAALQFEFEVEGMKARPEQHGDFAQLDAFLAQLQDALRDESRLRMLVLRANQ